jgi:hypothetical protein
MGISQRPRPFWDKRTRRMIQKWQFCSFLFLSKFREMLRDKIVYTYPIKCWYKQKREKEGPSSCQCILPFPISEYTSTRKKVDQSSMTQYIIKKSRKVK